VRGAGADTPRADLFWELARLIAHIPGLSHPLALRRAAETFAERFGARIDVGQSGMILEDLYATLRACDAYPDGLRFYLDTLGSGRTGTLAWADVEQMYLRLYPARLLTSTEYDELCELLASRTADTPLERIALRFLPELPARAGGATAPYTVVDLLEAFEDALIMPDEAHPLVSFVEAVAVRQPDPLETRLRAWNDKVAHRIGTSVEELRRVRSRESARLGRPFEPCRLLVEIAARPAAPDDYRVRGWLLAPGQGPRSLLADHRASSRHELEDTVAGLHQVVLDLLGELSAGLEVEFVLPRPLLWLEVDQFMIRPAGSVARPIGADHTVLVRSRERFANRSWWPALHRRLGWLESNPDRTFAAPHVQCLGAGQVPAPADLLRQHRGRETPFCFVLLDPPAYDGDLDADPVYVLLEVGVPAIVALRRHGQLTRASVELWNLLAGRLDQLPDRVRLVRGGVDADGDGSSTALDLHRHVTLVWDSQDGLEGAEATLGHPQTGGGQP
jgi:hypothetical protein